MCEQNIDMHCITNFYYDIRMHMYKLSNYRKSKIKKYQKQNLSTLLEKFFCIPAVSPKIHEYKCGKENKNCILTSSSVEKSFGL